MSEDSSAMERLTEALERMAVPRAPAPAFKPPRFSGTGNVEIFISQFMDVAEANDWNRAATLLHLRGALKDEARDCGGADTAAEILEALRARYGLTTREARSRLTYLRKEFKTSLQEHAKKVEELVQVAYPDIRQNTRVEMTVDHFVNSLGNAALQRHLLAVQPDSLVEAVRAGNEYLQVRTPQYGGGVKQLEEDIPDEHSGVAPVQANPMSVLTETLANLTKQFAELQAQLLKRSAPPRDLSRIKCFGCGKLGHFQTKCPEKAKPEEQGNAQGQQ
jgi:hypothetical protein